MNNKGNFSKDKSDKIANEEYKKFRVIQNKEYKSDFDEFLEKTIKLIKE